MKHEEIKRTILWKLHNIPPILFRLGLFFIPIYFFWKVWVIDIGEIEKISIRSTLLIMRGVTALCAIWIIDCLTRIHGFTNTKFFLMYEVIKAAGLICCILFISIALVVKGYYEIPIWYFLSPVGFLIVFPVRKLRQLSHILGNYETTKVKDIDTIKISVEQVGLDISGGYLFNYMCYLNYQIIVKRIVYKSDYMLNSIIRHKFADYKNGKPLRIIYSVRDPKFNIIFQE